MTTSRKTKDRPRVPNFYLIIREESKTKASRERTSSTGNRGNPKCVFVGNLAYETRWQGLKDYFKQVGDVAYADVFQTQRNRSKGCG